MIRWTRGRARAEGPTTVSGAAIAPIQALRGIAAAAVVLWHASRLLTPNGAGAVAQFLQPGAVMGVDLFFLISGFIMVHTTRGADGTAGYVAGFLVKRITRVWPLWTIALAAAVATQLDPGVLTEPARRIWLLHSLLFLPTAGVAADVAPIYGAPVLGVGWTLNYEMYFYAIFAASMLFGRWRWAAFSAWVGATVLMIPLLGGKLAGLSGWLDFLSCDRHYHYGVQYLNLVTSPLILLFVAGVLIGLLHRSPAWQIENRRFAAALAVAATVAVAVQFVLAFRPYHGVLHWGLTLIPLLLISALTSRPLGGYVPRWLSYLGDISFSLYLWHPIVLGGAAYFLRSEASGSAAFRFGVAILALVAAFALAALSHRYIERGLSDALRRRMFAQFKGLRPGGSIGIQAREAGAQSTP